MSGHRGRNWRSWSFCTACRTRPLPLPERLSALRPLSLPGTISRDREPSGNGWKRKYGVPARSRVCQNRFPWSLCPACPCGTARRCCGTASSDSARDSRPGAATASACTLQRPCLSPLQSAASPTSAWAFLWQRGWRRKNTPSFWYAVPSTIKVFKFEARS